MQPAIPPGWYHDGWTFRWWDGAAWGPAAPPVNPDQAGQTVAVLAHIGCVAGGFVAPLVVFLVSSQRGSFARHHGAEALNFQLTILVVWVVSLGAMVGAVVASAAASGVGPAPWVVFTVYPLMFMLLIMNHVFSIIGMVKAAQLKRWRYPLSIRFVKP